MNISYNYADTDYYLQNYKQIKLELNLFLVTNLKSNSDDKTISQSKTGKENEASLINKLDDYKYKKDKWALKCVDELYRAMDSRTRDIMRNKYILRYSNFSNSRRVYCSQSTVDKVVKKQKNILLEKFNKR